jgi:hypothetical protein
MTQEVSHSENIKEDLINPIITKDDFQMAVNITKFSVKNSLIIMQKNQKDENNAKQEKKPVPEPSQISMEYLMSHQTHVKNILRTAEIKIKDITRMKNYPNGTGGRVPALKFVKGLELNGLGTFSKDSDSFKRFHPDDDECPSPDDVKAKWQRLMIE